MRLAVISDVHGNHRALAAVLARVSQRGYDEILCLGDLAGYYSFVPECLDLISSVRTVAVRGNHDHVMLGTRGGIIPEAYETNYGRGLRTAAARLEARHWSMLEALPIGRELSVECRTFLICHGAPWDPLEGRVYPDFTSWERFDTIAADVVLMGHTHYPFAYRHGPMLIVNPGSVGQSRDVSGSASFAWIDLDAGSVEIERVPYDRTEIIADARRHSPELEYLVRVLAR